MEAIADLGGRRTPRNAIGDQRQEQRHRVRHHVPCVRDQRERARDEAAGRLHQRIARRHQKHGADASFVACAHFECVVADVIFCILVGFRGHRTACDSGLGTCEARM